MAFSFLLPVKTRLQARLRLSAQIEKRTSGVFKCLRINVDALYLIWQKGATPKVQDQGDFIKNIMWKLREERSSGLIYGEDAASFTGSRYWGNAASLKPIRVVAQGAVVKTGNDLWSEEHFFPSMLSIFEKHFGKKGWAVYFALKRYEDSVLNWQRRGRKIIQKVNEVSETLLCGGGGVCMYLAD